MPCAQLDLCTGHAACWSFSDLVLLNRRNRPEQVMQLVAERVASAF
jgi:hypothetical protein